MSINKQSPAAQRQRRRSPRRGSATTRVSMQGLQAPQMPHERDESSESQTSAPRAVMQQAHADVARGLVDTDRSADTDALYRSTLSGPPVLQPAEQPSRTQQRGTPRRTPR